MTMPEAEQHLSLAVEAVLKRFGAMVRQVGRRYRLDDSDVDEVLQEVRIRLWRAQRKRIGVLMRLDSALAWGRRGMPMMHGEAPTGG
jgi:DNA-directed RNA polymerase specialized sigma24 family protein